MNANMKDFISFLESNRIEFKTNEPLAKHTSYKIGGPCDVLVLPNHKNDLAKILLFINQNNIDFFILGKGSNLLFTDKGYKGVVIKLNSSFNFVNFNDEYAHVGGVCSVIRLSLLAAKNGLSGLEFASGIPATLGGAICMNAGAHGSDFSNIVEYVTLLNNKGETVVLSNEELQFQYRNSIICKKEFIVIEALLKLEKGNKNEISKKTASFKEKRISTQPYELPSCGSVFKNPLPKFSGALIESVGLKGYKIGGAMISDIHANFIVNLGNAKAHDVISLINLAQQKVKSTYNIDLIPEVKIIGEK